MTALRTILALVLGLAAAPLPSGSRPCGWLLRASWRFTDQRVRDKVQLTPETRAYLEGRI